MKYSTNIIESFFNLFKYIDDLMNFKKMESILFEMRHFPLQNDVIIQEIKNFKKPIEHFELYSKEDVGNDIIDMLNHVKGIKSLDLTASFSKDFELNCPPNLSYLYIHDSKWVNLRKLLQFNSSEIQIQDYELTDMDLCAFFQFWMSSESHLNLEKIEIEEVKRETFANVSRNLTHEEFDASLVHKFPAWQIVLDCFIIKRNDGTTATIYLTEKHLWPNYLKLGMVVEACAAVAQVVIAQRRHQWNHGQEDPTWNPTAGNVQNEEHVQAGIDIQRGPDAGVQAPEEHLVQFGVGQGFDECPLCHGSATRDLARHQATPMCQRRAEEYRRRHGHN